MPGSATSETRSLAAARPLPNAPAAGRGGIETATLLSFTAGFVDTCSFVALFGLFTAHITGNFVIIGARLAEDVPALMGKLLAVPVFVLAVLMVWHHVRRKKRGPVPLLATQLALLLLFMAAGLAAPPAAHADEWSVVLTGLVAIAAMGVQNGTARTVFAHLGPTTVMTGNLTQLLMDAADILRGGTPDGERATAKARLARSWPPIAAFIGGAGSAGLGYALLGYWCLLVPIGTVTATLALHLRRGSRAGI